MLIPNSPNTNFTFLTIRVDDLTTLHVSLRSIKAFFQVMYDGKYPSYRLDRLIEEVESTIDNYFRGNNHDEV